MDNYLIISRDECGNYRIRAEYNGRRYPTLTMVFYSKRGAVKEYRRHHGLTGKRFTVIDWTREGRRSA